MYFDLSTLHNGNSDLRNVSDIIMIIQFIAALKCLSVAVFLSKQKRCGYFSEVGRIVEIDRIHKWIAEGAYFVLCSPNLTELELV